MAHGIRYRSSASRLYRLSLTRVDLSMESSGLSHVSSMDRVAALYRDHLQFIVRVLWRTGMPMADAEDIAHEIFIVVLQKLRESPTKASLSTHDEERAWLYTIADYHLKNYRSRARFRRTQPMDDCTQEIPDRRNDAARMADREQLLVLLESTTPERREVFELVELENFSVVAAARALGITEGSAHGRLRLAREDIGAAAAKLAQRDKNAGKTKNAFLLPFGVGAWLQLRDLQNPPESTADRIWQRFQATVALMDREHDQPATTTPPPSPARPRARRLLEKLAGPLKARLGNLFSACLGGAIVALLFLLRPSAKIATLRIPVPLFVVTNSTTTPAPLPAPSSSPTPPPPATDAIQARDATFDQEAFLIRQARVAFERGNRQGTIDALAEYERQFPGGRFMNTIREMRTTLPDASAR